MGNSVERKAALEWHVAEPFALFLAGKGILLTDLRPGDPRRFEPDVVGDSEAGAVGIEVTTLLWSTQSWQNLSATIGGHPERSTIHLVLGENPRDLARRCGSARTRQIADRRQRERLGLPLVQPAQPSERLAQLAHEKLVDKCAKTYCMPT